MNLPPPPHKGIRFQAFFCKVTRISFRWSFFFQKKTLQCSFFIRRDT